MPTAILLSQGDEVVTGQIADTNAAWLASELTGLGVQVLRHISVGDNTAAIQQQIKEASMASDVIISTGGLGPTEDDLTTAAVASLFEKTLILDPESLAQIEGYYAKAKRTMPVVNKKQAYFPEGASRINNHWGTAPGFAIHANQCLQIYLPGVPKEMKPMFSTFVSAMIEETFALAPHRLITFRTTGVGESTLQERIGTFYHDEITLSYRTKSPENHIKLRIPHTVSEEEVQRVCTDLSSSIGSPLFAIDGMGQGPEGSLQAVVGQLLLKNGEHVSVAESCTGGRICSMFTEISGSSQWFTEGAVTYSNEAKVNRLGVDANTLTVHGAVSEAVCQEMAVGIRQRSGTTYGLATTGIAGPTGGSAEKPVGTVFIGLQTPTQFFCRRLRLAGSRARIQSLSAAACVDMLRRHLQQFDL